MTWTSIELADFKSEFSTLVELSSAALGGRIVSVSDEFFAEAENLLKVEPAPSLKGQFGPNGALFSGWETRRHNPEHDWCIIKLGASGSIGGFDIDTAWFSGNEAPAASVEALTSAESEPPSEQDHRWTTILPKVFLGPNSRHLFKTAPSDEAYNYVKLSMYPDGGIARFRVYGLVKAVLDSPNELVDLASVFSGARVVFTSDQHFGVGSNLLLPGRGKDMGDGWETKRSRTSGHKDWVIVKLGHPGYLEHVEIDTAHFKGNFPESCELHCLLSDKTLPENNAEWTKVLPRTKLGPHRRHVFQLEETAAKRYSHAMLTIYPDGGVKRLRLLGRLTPVSPSGEVTSHFPHPLMETNEAKTGGLPVSPDGTGSGALVRTIPALWLTPEAFASFGHVIQTWADTNATPKGIKTTPANQGTAIKFHRLAPVVSSYAVETGARTAISTYRAHTTPGAAPGHVFRVELLERHPCTNQAFLPLGAGGGLGEDAIPGEPARAYLVVVALNGKNDKPDVSTMRAFLATTAQGISYDAGVWHHPLITLENTIDFGCVETQIGGGAPLDCEIVEPSEIVSVNIPKF